MKFQRKFQMWCLGHILKIDLHVTSSFAVFLIFAIVFLKMQTSSVSTVTFSHRTHPGRLTQTLRMNKTFKKFLDLPVDHHKYVAFQNNQSACMMFFEMNKYDAPCPNKRAMEESAIKALQDCEDEFDPFVGGIVPSSKAENVVLSSGEYFLSDTNSCCVPGNENEKGKPTLVDAFYQALFTNAREEKASNTEIAGWKTCHYPHRSELSEGFLHKIREEISEKLPASVNKSRSTPRAHSPQKVPISSSEKIEKPSKTLSWTGQKLPSAPICKAGKSPECETCIREMLRDKRTEERELGDAEPPTSGSYFAKAAAEMPAAPQTPTKLKQVRSVKPNVQAQECVANRKPKLRRVKGSLVTHEDGIFPHDMSGSYYTELYRFIYSMDNDISCFASKFEQRASTTRLMKSVIHTKLTRSRSNKPVYLQSPVPNQARVSNIVVQLADQDPDSLCDDDLQYYDHEENVDIVEKDPVCKRYQYRGKTVRKQETPPGNRWTNQSLNYMYTNRGAAGTKLPQGIHRANLPQCDKKEKRKSASNHRVSARGVPIPCRPFSGIDSSADSAPRMLTADRNAATVININRSRPSIPSNARGVVCPTAVVTQACFVKKSKKSTGIKAKRLMFKAESFNDFMDRNR